MAGRPKGSQTRNSKFLLNRLKEIYGEEFEPVMRMAEMATLLQAEAMSCEKEHKSRAIKDAIDGWDKIAKYVQPTLKAVEISGTDGDSLPAISVTIVRGSDEGGDTGGV